MQQNDLAQQAIKDAQYKYGNDVQATNMDITARNQRTASANPAAYQMDYLNNPYGSNMPTA